MARGIRRYEKKKKAKKEEKQRCRDKKRMD